MKALVAAATLTVSLVYCVWAFDTAVFAAFQEESARAMRELRVEDYPPPYFIGLRAVDEKSWRYDFREGVQVAGVEESRIYFTPSVRVGSYVFDQTPDMHRQKASDDPLPFGAGVALLRHYIWAALDRDYKEAVAMYFTKKAKRSAEGAPEYATDDFAPAPPSVFTQEFLEPSVDTAYLKHLAEVSSLLGAEPLILKSLVHFNYISRKNYFTSTEGSKIFFHSSMAQLYLSLYGKSDKGLPVHVTRTFLAFQPADLPDRARLEGVVKEMKDLYFELARSSEAQGALAPCLLDPAASSQLFAAFVERLEGERQRDPHEPQTFRGKRGHKILPEFLTIMDDPTRARFKGEVLMGSYPFDEEGLAPQPVTLVHNGVLKGFLLSRRPVKGLPKASNGHGRAAPGYLAHARMANLLVQSARERSAQQLRGALLQEVRRRNLPFGVVVQGLRLIRQDSGTGSHQTLRAEPQRLALLYPDGREEVVHNGEIVGTPLNLMQSILATGNDYKVVHFLMPGASGSIPVSVVAPSVLIREIEIQKGSAKPMRPPILPSPLSQ